MKTNIYRYFSFLVVVIIITAACSTKKDKYINRKFHSVTTKYNVLYNGNLALDAGLQELAMTPDNFWDVLPVERMQITEPIFGQDSVPRNANFKRAEDKAVKAIEKHSMNIGGAERNPQMDEAYLLLGKARYYDQRFIPALEALNFILHKYPDSDKINELKIWKEKVNIRLENNGLAIQNLSKLLKEIKFKDQVTADANAILAQAYYNENKNDSAIACLKRAKEYTEIKEEKARYTFILAQLLEKEGNTDQAISSYNQVVEMNRKSPRQYVIQSHAKITQLSTNIDSVLLVKKFDKLLKDRENRPYLDVLHHQLGLYYDKNKNTKKALENYNRSLFKKSNDVYMVASNYRNIAEIYFYSAKYSVAGKYYDSTLVNLDDRTREFRHIKRKRENLEDVIKYEAIAVNNDSILNLVRMSEQERIDFFTKHIERLKKEQELLEKEAKSENYVSFGSDDVPARRKESLGDISADEMMPRPSMQKNQDKVAARSSSPGMPPATTPASNSNFYFYNQTAVAQGKSDFRRKWGTRPLKDYWRLANYTDSSIAPEAQETDEEGNVVASENKPLEPRFTVEFYLNQIPTDQAAIAELQKERNFAYYQLGIIYKDKFREYKLAQTKLEGLLESNPEERLILPSMYNLYKIYEILGSDKMLALKNRIISEYPDSRYAQIISNPNSNLALSGTPDQVYNSMYEFFENAQYKQLLTDIEPLIDQYSGEEIISKLELLKANAIGNLRGLEAYKDALNYVSLTYPNSLEGKEAENILVTNVPKLEKMNFGKKSNSWKLIYKTSESEDLTQLNKKLERFINDRPQEKLKITFDGYTETENFLTIHNIDSEQKALDMITILTEYKDYKITEKFVQIATEDYKIVQIKKNYDAYLQHSNLTP